MAGLPGPATSGDCRPDWAIVPLMRLTLNDKNDETVILNITVPKTSWSLSCCLCRGDTPEAERSLDDRLRKQLDASGL